MINDIYNHFCKISKHKFYVAIECFKKGLYWQGIVHDLSKYSMIEFCSSAKYFSGTGSPIDNEKRERGYSLAWLNHKAKNKHHWDYWVDFVEGAPVPCNIPDKYLLEMVSDMIGASKAYKGGKYDSSEPLKYFIANKHKWIATKHTLETIEILLKQEIINKEG